MIKVNSLQFNYQYGDQIHFPYSIGSLVTFLKTDEKIKANFKFEKTFVFRDHINEYINSCSDTDILLCSSYVWNWEITTHLAREIKKINPNSLIIFGGPQVPNDTTGFFEKYPFVDILVRAEGEVILMNIFKAYMKDQDYSHIKGITTKDYGNPPEDRINDLDSIHSPYLSNTVWDLVDKVEGVNWICSWETNRGCPYMCTFCDWGSATFTTMRKFSIEKLFAEIEWFADNKIIYIDCCDSNFGIFPRDMDLAKKLSNESLKKQYPKTFRQSWAKNSSEKIIPIAKELQLGGLLTAVGLAVETLDERTLNIIKRKNIQFDKFSELTESFFSNGLPTYTEIIRGLPGETLESFKNGLESMVADTKIGSIFIYNCSVLPNAPLNEPEYRQQYNIKMVRSSIYLAHSSIHERGIDEYEDIIISSNSFTLEDLKEMYLYSWLVLTFQNLGILEYISKYYNKEKAVAYMKFYEVFLDFCRNNKSIFADVYKIVKKHIDDGYAGKGWNYQEPELGDINWPIEEATWLQLSKEKQKLWRAINSFLYYFENKLGYKSSNELLEDLTRFQVFLLSTKDDRRVIKSESFKLDWKDYFTGSGKLKSFGRKYNYRNRIIEKDSYEWNKKVMWYGRRTRKYKFDPEKLSEGEFFKEKSEVKIEVNPKTIKTPP